MEVRQAFKTMVLAAALLPILGSCKKDNDDPIASYPRSVTIQYKVTNVSGTTQIDRLSYTNETGGTTNLEDVTLPFTKSVTKTVKFGEMIALSTSNTELAAHSYKLEILADGEVKKSELFEGTTALIGTIAYGFQ